MAASELSKKLLKDRHIDKAIVRIAHTFLIDGNGTHMQGTYYQYMKCECTESDAMELHEKFVKKLHTIGYKHGYRVKIETRVQYLKEYCSVSDDKYGKASRMYVTKAYTDDEMTRAYDYKALPYMMQKMYTQKDNSQTMYTQIEYWQSIQHAIDHYATYAHMQVNGVFMPEYTIITRQTGSKDIPNITNVWTQIDLVNQ